MFGSVRHTSFMEQGKSEGFDSCDRLSDLTETSFKSWIFGPYDIEILWMILKNNRAPLVCYIKLCVSFQSHSPEMLDLG